MRLNGAITYFKKYGCIYGISEKHEFGKWCGYSYKFNDIHEAIKWRSTEEADFRIREFCGKTKATKTKNITYLGGYDYE